MHFNKKFTAMSNQQLIQGRASFLAMLQNIILIQAYGKGTKSRAHGF